MYHWGGLESKRPVCASAMLTLSQSRQLGAVTVYRDFTLVDGRVQYTNIFYILASTPRFQVVDGDPSFDFIWYRTSAGSSAKAGGLVTMTLELSLNDEVRASLPQSIATAFSVDAATVELRSVPYKSGSVELVYAGESGSGEFANQISGNGPALLTGSEQATFVVDLSKDGAALLWEAIDKAKDLFHLRYDLVFDHRLANVHMRIWCDASKSPAGSDPALLRVRLTEQRLAGVEITSEEPLSAEHSAALQKAGEDLLTRALGQALVQQQSSEQMASSLNFSLDESYPLEQHAVMDAILHLELTPEQASRRLRQVDFSNSLFQVLDIQIVCTADFSLGLIDAVHVKIGYEASTSDYLFKETSAPIQHFRTLLAAPGKNRYRYSVDVFYSRQTEPLHLEFPETDGTVIVVDVDAIGILDVAVDLRDVPFESVTNAVVEVRYPTLGLTATFILDGKTMHARWRAVVREAPQSWEYKADWVLRDGRRIPGTWTTTAARSVYLDAPAELKQKLKVQVATAGDFTELSQILVDLRSRADPQVQTQLAFTGSGETHLWEAAGATVQLDYEYRRTFVYKDGHIRQDPSWVAGSRPVLVVMDESRFQVSIVPKLLDLGATLKMVIVELESVADQPERKTIVVKSKDDQIRWRFGIESPDRHVYRYRLTALNRQGERQPTTEWRESDSAILVLQLEKTHANL